MLMRFLSLIFLACISCQTNSRQHIQEQAADIVQKPLPKRVSGQKVIHVFVALCDNTYQGIVPVPVKIGNGQDPVNNLYWGCAYGVKTFFTNSKEWVLQKDIITNIQKPILERCVFKNRFSNTILIADAYDGQFIKTCTEVFLKACSGAVVDSVILKDGNKIFAGGSSHLLASLKREAIILACISKPYFAPVLKQTAAQPILWSTGLMAPEAYVLHDAVSAWIKNEPAETIRNTAAAAYSKYQKCSVKAARNLLVTGWKY
jgi:hypothetical protein